MDHGSKTTVITNLTGKINRHETVTRNFMTYEISSAEGKQQKLPIIPAS